MDLNAIKARMQAARSKWVPAAGKEFLVHRPSDLHFHRLAARGLNPRQVNLEMVIECVHNWRGVTAADLADDEETGLTEEQLAEAVPFDREAFELYIGDRVGIVTELAGAIGELVEARAKREKEKKT